MVIRGPGQRSVAAWAAALPGIGRQAVALLQSALLRSTLQLSTILLPTILLPMIPAAAHGSTLLFRSGFEAGVRIDPLDGHGSDYQLLHGADAGGHRFPIDLWGVQPGTSGVLAIVGPRAPAPAAHYIRNTIETVTGPDGTPTRALAMRILRASPATCCTQDTFQLGVLRGGVEPVLRQRMRVRLDEDLATRAAAFGSRHFWRMLWEMKAEPDDYRIRLELQVDPDGRLFWRIQGDRLVDADALWAYENRAIPVVPGRWFTVEVCMDRPSGRFWASIDGIRVGTHRGNLYGHRRLATSSVKHAILYGEPAEGAQWIDDLEIHAAASCD